MPDPTGATGSYRLKMLERQHRMRFTGIAGLCRHVRMPLAVCPERPHAPRERFYRVAHAARVHLDPFHHQSVARHHCQPGQRGRIDTGELPFSSMDELVSFAAEEESLAALFGGGLVVNFEEELAGPSAPLADDFLPERTPGGSQNGRAKFRGEPLGSFGNAENASLLVDGVVAGLTTDPSRSFGHRIAFSGLPIAPPNFLRGNVIYTSRPVIKAGEMVPAALDRVQVGRDVAVLFWVVLRRCGFEGERATADLRSALTTWPVRLEAARQSWRGHEGLARTRFARFLGMTGDERRGRRCEIIKWLELEFNIILELGDVPFDLMEAARWQPWLTAWLAQLQHPGMTEDEVSGTVASFFPCFWFFFSRATAALKSFFSVIFFHLSSTSTQLNKKKVGRIRRFFELYDAVAVEARETAEKVRLFAGGRARHTLASLLGIGRPDPADYNSERFWSLPAKFNAFVTRAEKEKLEQLRRDFPRRDRFPRLETDDRIVLRVRPAPALGDLPPLEAARRKEAAYFLLLRYRRQGLFDGSPDTLEAVNTLSRSLGGEEPEESGDDFDSHEDYDDNAIAELAAEFGFLLAPLRDEQHVSPLKVLKRVKDFVKHASNPQHAGFRQEGRGGLAARARAFLIKVTAGFDAPCRVKGKDLGFFDLLEHFTEPQWNPVVLRVLEHFALRACDHQVLLRFARIHGDLRGEPVDVTGIRADVRDLIYAICPPGLDDPPAALFFVRVGLVAVSDPTLFDTSGFLAAHQAATYLPYDLELVEFTAAFGAVQIAGASVLFLPSGEISISDPALDRLYERTAADAAADAAGGEASPRRHLLKPAMLRVLTALCQVPFFDLGMAYSDGVFVEVVMPEEQRVVVSGAEMGQEALLVSGDRLLFLELGKARDRPSFSRLSVSPHGVFGNSMGASAGAIGGRAGPTAERSVAAAVDALVGHRFEGRLPASFFAAGEITRRPDVPPPYTRVVLRGRSGHRSGGKGTVVSLLLLLLLLKGDGEKES